MESVSLRLYWMFTCGTGKHPNISSNGICVYTFIFGCLPVPQSSNAVMLTDGACLQSGFDSKTGSHILPNGLHS